MYWKIIIISS